MESVRCRIGPKPATPFRRHRSRRIGHIREIQSHDHRIVIRSPVWAVLMRFVPVVIQERRLVRVHMPYRSPCHIGLHGFRSQRIIQELHLAIIAISVTIRFKAMNLVFVTLVHENPNRVFHIQRIEVAHHQNPVRLVMVSELAQLVHHRVCLLTAAAVVFPLAIALVGIGPAPASALGLEMIDAIDKSLARSNLTKTLHQFTVERVHGIDHEITTEGFQLGFPVHDMVERIGGALLMPGPTDVIVFLASFGLVQGFHQSGDDSRTAPDLHQTEQIGINSV